MQFKEGSIKDVVIKDLAAYNDQRGWLAEIFREDEFPEGLKPAMAYVSMTRPGVARGPHGHHFQTDVFAFIGPSDFKVYLWDNRQESPTYGNKIEAVCGVSKPAVVIVPPGVVHGYKNIGAGDGMVINLPDKLYRGPNKKEEVDEIRYENDPASGFII